MGSKKLKAYDAYEHMDQKSVAKIGAGPGATPSKKVCQRGTGHQKPRRLLCLSATAGSY